MNYLPLRGLKLIWKNEVYYDGLWLMGGDFNVIYDPSERKGSSVCIRKLEHMEFKTFIN